jgi:DNA-binding MarR family transcriptional regulator
MRPTCAEQADEVSRLFAAIYHRCHPIYGVQLGHQAVRVLHLVAEEGDAVTVQRAAAFIGSARNTASELVGRLVERGLLMKRRDATDERVVHLALTAAGRLALDEHVGLDRSHLATALRRADPATRARIVDGMQALLAVVERTSP